MAKTYTGLTARILGGAFGAFWTVFGVGMYTFAGLYAPNVPFPDLGLGVTPADPMPLPILVTVVVVPVVAIGVGVKFLTGALLESDYTLTVGEGGSSEPIGYDGE